MGKVTIIKNGIVFNAVNKAFTKKDVYVKDDEIIAEEDIEETDLLTEWDAKGSYVAPGFIDMHVHVFENFAQIGINADKIGINQGVTTVVDAGSTGYKDYAQFKDKIINQHTTEILSLLNVSAPGLVEGLDELSAPEKLMSERAWETIKASEPAIVGLKARMSQSVVGNQGIRPLEHARKLADQTDTPIMVHIGSPPPPLNEILPLLKNGDIVTHAFHGKKGGILDEDAALIPEAHEALERGVKFDVGHGTSSFSYQTIKRFKENYSYPFTISTDVYEKNFEQPVGSLMDTISKLLAVGYDLEDLIESVTILPARTLSLMNYGSLEPGKKADITMFHIEKKNRELIDSHGEVMKVNQRLIPQTTWKNGKIVYQRG
ncbi:amidohydrolase/deacetylase family metallohydrolase [Oceanobacillus oncorhynchi subsp. oncorhynchi]|uniref:amidohydrolase/deacetylase family metallohydrolase n=1 Tax=Oceanobacillus oncorhynchi TaxID=545501 RepID=UPI0031DEB6DA